MSIVRVLELRSTYGDGGGPDKTILYSAARHDTRRVAVECLYLRGTHDARFSIGQRARSLGVPFHEVPERGRFDPQALLTVFRLVRHVRPHVIHTHDYKSDLLGQLLRGFFRPVSHLATAHGWTLDNSMMKLYNQLDLKVLARCDRVIAVSRATRDRLVQGGVPEARIEVLHNAIDTDFWCPGERNPAAMDLCQRAGIPSTSRLIGIFGRLSPEKDVATALQALVPVLQALPEVHAVVIGDGAALPSARARSRACGIGHRVHFLGPLPLTPAFYRALDLYLMTSLTEGLPNTLLEAMACGIPSVVTAVGGIPELTGGGDGAVLCAPQQPMAIAKAILDVLQDPPASRCLGLLARQRVVDYFSFTSRLERIETLYQDLAQVRSRQGVAPEALTL